MQRILIIGCPGSGKSTFAKKLAEKTKLPLIHLDRLFWKSGWIERSREEFDALVSDELNKDRWIIDGNYLRTLSDRMKYADTIIFFDYPTYICLWRVLKRIVKKHGTTRDDMGENCPERFDMGFIKYILGFRKNQREKIYQKLSFCTNAEIVIVHSKKDFGKIERTLLF